MSRAMAMRASINNLRPSPLCFSQDRRANMADYMKSTPEGDPYLDFSALTRDQTAALSEVTVEDFLDRRGDDARR
jgi:hypothetical protein